PPSNRSCRTRSSRVARCSRWRGCRGRNAIRGPKKSQARSCMSTAPVPCRPSRKQIPAYPYYGTIDATPWFLVALSEHARVTRDLSLSRELWPNVLAALEWISRWGDRDGDGFLEYQRDGDEGLRNQCWMDSEDSIRFRDGRL